MTSYVGRLIGSVLLWFPVLADTGQESRSDLRAELSRLYAEQRFEEMLRLLQPSLSETGDSADLWIMAAEAAFKLEDFPRAIKCFERGAELRPALKAATINLGFAYLKLDRLDHARAVFDSFLKDSNHARAGKAHYGLGLVLSARGDAEEARKAFAASVALDPEDARPHYRLGQLALQGGHHAQAIASFTAATRSDELHYGAAYGLARAYALAGNAPEAERWTERHRKILEVTDAVTNMIRRLGHAEDPVLARIAIGLKLQDAGAHAKAAAWYERALKLDPSNAEARRRLKEIGQARAESRR